MEACSLTPWFVVPCLWVPVAVHQLLAGLRLRLWAVELPAVLVMGLLHWLAMEYFYHRYLFHARPTSYWRVLSPPHVVFPASLLLLLSLLFQQPRRLNAVQQST